MNTLPRDRTRVLPRFAVFAIAVGATLTVAACDRGSAGDGTTGPDGAVLAFEGSWSPSAAEAAALQIIEANDGLFDFPDDQPLLHQTVGQFASPVSGTPERRVLVMSTMPGVGWACHACSVRLSIFEFVSVRDGWAIAASTVNALDDGSWGEPPAVIEATRVGPQAYAVQFSHHYTAQGYQEAWTRLYERAENGFGETFYLKTRETDPTGAGWETVLAFDERPGETHYDIVVTERTVSGLLSTSPPADTTPPTTPSVTYRFDGTVYVRVDP